MADQVDELAEVAVESRNRFPGARQRISRARETLSPGTLFPRITALLNPTLFRQRADTNALLEDTLADDGPLARIAASNPELVNELRQQAASPMSVDQHKQFRSALLGMVSSEVERETKIRSTLQDNQSWLDAFVALDGSIPGIKDPERTTYEEAERKQILGLYEQAQRLALTDPDGSKAIMADARKRADTLTANVRQLMEQTRKRATLEDSALFGASDDAAQIIRDARGELDWYLGQNKDVPEFVLQKALQAYGAANAIQTTNLGQVTAGALGEAVSGTIGGATRGAPGAALGAISGLALGGGQELVRYFKDKGKVKELHDTLGRVEEQIALNYQNNRKQLIERYAPVGMQFGKPGEVYAVLDDKYRAESEKLPAAPEKTPQQTEAEKTATVRQMLEDEKAAADEAVSKLGVEASANMPGAAARLAAAVERQRIASDDVAIFADDQRIAAGGAELDDENAAKAIAQARARRKNRAEAVSRSKIRAEIHDALRGYTR